jgi:predicted RNA-binding protein with PUA-like domain
MSYWLFKEEPSHYSFDDLMRDKRTVWSGVENALALKHLRTVRQDDQAFFYHTGNQKAVVGVMQVVKDAYPDPKRKDPKFVVVDVKPIERLARPVTLAEIKAHPEFADLALVRISRLSVMPVTPRQWREIRRMAGE